MHLLSLLHAALPFRKHRPRLGADVLLVMSASGFCSAVRCWAHKVRRHNHLPHRSVPHNAEAERSQRTASVLRSWVMDRNEGRSSFGCGAARLRPTCHATVGNFSFQDLAASSCGLLRCCMSPPSMANFILVQIRALCGKSSQKLCGRVPGQLTTDLCPQPTKAQHAATEQMHTSKHCCNTWLHHQGCWAQG